MGTIAFDVTFFIQLGNFLVTLVVLNYLLIRPVRAHIQKRKDMIAGNLGEIERFTSSAEERLNAYEASLDEARASATRTREALKAEAQQSEHSLIANAQANAQDVIKAAKADAAQQAEAALAVLKKKVPAFADQIVTKVLQ